MAGYICLIAVFICLIAVFIVMMSLFYSLVIDLSNFTKADSLLELKIL
jgi:hypothetical protein